MIQVELAHASLSGVNWPALAEPVSPSVKQGCYHHCHPPIPPGLLGGSSAGATRLEI